MKPWYKIKDNEWKLLPVSFDSMMLTKEIDKVSISTFQIPKRMYETMFSGLGVVSTILEDFEDHTIGAQLEAEGGWTSDNEDASCDAVIEAGKHAKFTDLNNSGSFRKHFTFPSTGALVVGDWISIRVKITDGLLYIYPGQNDGYDLFQLKFDNGNIYYYNIGAGAYVDSTVDYIEDEWFTIRMTVQTLSGNYVDKIAITVEQNNNVIYKADLETNENTTKNCTRLYVQSDDAGQVIAYIDDISCSWITESRGWTMDNEDWPFMKVIVMDDAYDPNVDVHEVPYIWFGQCIRINGDELNTFITCEEIHGSFMREVIAEDDNIVPGGPHEIDSFDSASVLVLTTSPFDVDGEIGRACRITAREPEGKVAVPASFSITVTGWNNNGTKTETGAYADCIIDNDDFYGVRIIGTSDDAVALEAIMEFSVERFPQRDMKIRLKGEFFANFNTPFLSIYNYVTTNYDLVQNVGPDTGALSSSPTNFIIPMVNVDLDKYYNESTKKMKFKLYSIYPLITNTIMEIYYVALEYTSGYQHDPVEFKIEDNAVDDITIVDVADEFDLVTERINEGDSVDIIYKNDEWLEDIIVDYAIGIAEIDAPASTSPTYSNKRNRLVGRDLSDTARLEGWFFRLSAELEHGFPILEFLDKTTLSGESYTLNSGYIIESNVKWAFNALDKLRKVIVDNGTINGESTELTAYPLNPVGVVTWKDVKAFIIDDIAQNIHDYRSAVTGNFEFVYDGTDFDEILPGDEVTFNIYSKELDSSEEITLVVRKVDVFRNRVKLTIGFNETERKPVNEMINEHLNRLTR